MTGPDDGRPIFVALAVPDPALADRLAALLADLPGLRLVSPGEPADVSVVPAEPEAGPHPDAELTPRELEV